MPEIFESWFTRDTRTGRIKRSSAIMLAAGGYAFAVLLVVGIAWGAVESVINR